MTPATTDRTRPPIYAPDGSVSSRLKMGEEDTSAGSNENTENGQENQNPDDIEEDDDDEMSNCDFVSLDLQLDELSTALDALEQRNDRIHAQLMKLLESNRETRQQFQKNLTDEQKIEPQV